MTEDTGLARLGGIVRRRKLTVIFTTALIAAGGIALVWRLPSEYQARAVVRIDDPRPAREYVSPTVSEPAVERLKSRRLSFLARPLIERARDKAGLADSVDSLAARLDARQEGEDSFVLTFTYGDRAKGQAFLEALTDYYQEERAAEATARASETAKFFDAQVAELRPRVAAADQKVEKYKLEHYGGLPEQLEANLRMLDEAQMELNAVLGSLDQALNRRSGIIADSRSPLRRQEEEAARALTSARSRYAADSNEVKNLEAELGRVRDERQADESENGRRTRSGSELRAAESEISRNRSRADELRGRERELRGRIEAAAKNGEELARLALDRDMLRDRLRTLVAKQEEASLAAGLESTVVGRARVAIIEPAWVTATPVKPAKPFLAAMALALAALVGVGLGWLLDATDRRVRTVEDMRRLTGDVPVLGLVPNLDAELKKHRSLLSKHSIRGEA